MTQKYCPCGTPVPPNREYCSPKCCGKYRPKKRPDNAFGGRSSKGRLAKGYRAWLDGE